ncbi:MAG: NCS2 family permease [Pseudomonadota bacterium]|nr:NCS2 family permease [Pseudomonadota bacterium]
MQNIICDENKLELKNEILAGIINFLTCAYISVINPMILSSAGIPEADVFLATCLTIGITCIFIGLRTNLPIMIGPTSAINTYFLAGITGNLGIEWHYALADVFVSGIIIFILAKFKLRSIINHAIPQNLTHSITFGIGIFVMMVAFSYSGIYIKANSGNIEIILNNLLIFSTTVGVSHIAKNMNIPGHTVIGLLVATTLYVILEHVSIPSIVSIPHSFESSFLALNFSEIFHIKNLAAIFAITIIVLLDSNASLATLLKALDSDASNNNCSKPMEAVGLATFTGSLLGTSSSGIYLETLSGIGVGGKTGITTIVAGILFFLTLLFSPLVHLIPNSATTAILFLIACDIVKDTSFFENLKWDEMLVSILIIITIPLQFSIVDGIGVGLLSYSILKLLQKKYKEVNIYLLTLDVVFICFFLVKFLIASHRI